MGQGIMEAFFEGVMLKLYPKDVIQRLGRIEQRKFYAEETLFTDARRIESKAFSSCRKQANVPCYKGPHKSLLKSLCFNPRAIRKTVRLR